MLMDDMKMGLGMGPEAAPAPISPEEYMAAGRPDGIVNPVASAEPMFPGGYATGEEPPLMGSAHLPGHMPGDLPGALPEGPESSMTDSAQMDLNDFLSQRAQARQSRSKHFQEKAREMARGQAGMKY
jgi:hypothetical protein